jgi:hypothetical protein
MSNETNFERQRDELIAEITAAFDGVSREGGTTLHEADAIDDWKSDEERRAARRLDTERRWQDVPDEDIWACCSALSFLDVKGFRYYLPAFMVYGLRHFEDDLNGILHSCVYHLLHEPQKSLRKSEPASIAGQYYFTDAQCRVIAKFLRFAAGDDDVTVTDMPELQAVEKWERYVEERSSGGGGI